MALYEFPSLPSDKEDNYAVPQDAPPDPVYVDAHLFYEPKDNTRESVYECLTKISRDIKRRDVLIGQALGSGQFGKVYKGKLSRPDGGKPVEVAVKMLNGSSSANDMAQFLKEAVIMGQWSHPNIIGLHGYVTKDGPPIIIIELADTSLEDLLQKPGYEASTKNILSWSQHVATAMVYLAARGYIHRDLACRNILLKNNIAKVADFGRSRDVVQEGEIYTTAGGKVPVRWTAPEALAFGTYSSSSDVWSYGVFLYELFTNAKTPYPDDWSNADVFDRISAGWRLGPPDDCPKIFYIMMMDCWEPEPSRRPSFTKIQARLKTVDSEAVLQSVSDSDSSELQDRYLIANQAPGYEEATSPETSNDPVYAVPDQPVSSPMLNVIDEDEDDRDHAMVDPLGDNGRHSFGLNLPRGRGKSRDTTRITQKWVESYQNRQVENPGLLDARVRASKKKSTVSWIKAWSRRDKSKRGAGP
eukprot:m.73939 g.73939  ORF g.73939 m.73939 type:complete len:471 (+) comp12440_c0_seq4:1402-2814(+)